MTPDEAVGRIASHHEHIPSVAEPWRHPADLDEVLEAWRRNAQAAMAFWSV